MLNRGNSHIVQHTVTCLHPVKQGQRYQYNNILQLTVAGPEHKNCDELFTYISRLLVYRKNYKNNLIATVPLL